MGPAEVIAQLAVDLLTLIALPARSLRRAKRKPSGSVTGLSVMQLVVGVALADLVPLVASIRRTS